MIILKLSLYHYFLLITVLFLLLTHLLNKIMVLKVKNNGLKSKNYNVKGFSHKKDFLFKGLKKIARFSLFYNKKIQVNKLINVD